MSKLAQYALTAPALDVILRLIQRFEELEDLTDVRGRRAIAQLPSAHVSVRGRQARVAVVPEALYIDLRVNPGHAA